MGLLFSSYFGKTKLRSDVVQTESGPIIGKRYNINHKFVDAFLGIPFAKPPVNELRFKVCLLVFFMPSIRVSH